jgi:hypothetical protein
MMMATLLEYGAECRRIKTRETHSNNNQQGEDIMASKPSHIAWVVTEPKEGTDGKAQWREVGALWPARNGNGFVLNIHEQFSISGRIVITERREPAADRPEEGQPRSAAQPGPSGRR